MKIIIQKILEVSNKNEKEIKQFDNIKRKPFPNSKRVLVPNGYPPENNRNLRKKQFSHFNRNSQDFDYISKVDYKVRRRPPSCSVKETFDFKELFEKEDDTFREVVAAQIRSASEFMPSLTNIYLTRKKK